MKDNKIKAKVKPEEKKEESKEEKSDEKSSEEKKDGDEAKKEAEEAPKEEQEQFFSLLVQPTLFEPRWNRFGRNFFRTHDMSIKMLQRIYLETSPRLPVTSRLRFCPRKTSKFNFIPKISEYGGNMGFILSVHCISKIFNNRVEFIRVEIPKIPGILPTHMITSSCMIQSWSVLHTLTRLE